MVQWYKMVLWRSGYAAVCKTAYTGSIPVGTSKLALSGAGTSQGVNGTSKKRGLRLIFLLNKSSLYF